MKQPTAPIYPELADEDEQSDFYNCYNQSTNSTDWSIVSECRLGKWSWTGT